MLTRFCHRYLHFEHSAHAPSLRPTRAPPLARLPANSSKRTAPDRPRRAGPWPAAATPAPTFSSPDAYATQERGWRSAKHLSSSRTSPAEFGETGVRSINCVRDRPRAARARPRDESRGGVISELIRTNQHERLREESSRARRLEVPSIESADWMVPALELSRCPAMPSALDRPPCGLGPLLVTFCTTSCLPDSAIAVHRSVRRGRPPFVPPQPP